MFTTTMSTSLACLQSLVLCPKFRQLLQAELFLTNPSFCCAGVDLKTEQKYNGCKDSPHTAQDPEVEPPVVR